MKQSRIEKQKEKTDARARDIAKKIKEKPKADYYIPFDYSGGSADATSGAIVYTPRIINGSDCSSGSTLATTRAARFDWVHNG